MQHRFYHLFDSCSSGHRLLNEREKTSDGLYIFLYNHVDRFCVHFQRHRPETDEVRMVQNLLEHGEEDRRNRGGMGVNPFRKPLSPLRLTHRLMAGQSRDVDFYDPLQRKFAEELLDELFEREQSARGGIAIDGPEMSDVQHETARHGRGHEPEKIRNRY